MSFSAQQTDPFYLSILEKAEKLFLAKDYQDAARDFEIAAFGLMGNKSLLAKAKVYIGLCKYYQNDLSASEKNLREAADLMGGRGFAPLEIQESARPDLDRLTSFFNLTAGQIVAPSQEMENPPSANSESQRANPGEPAGKPGEKQGQDAAKKVETHIVTPPPVSVNIEELKEGDLVPLDLVDTQPALIKKIPAVYPAYARPLRIEGTVLINALVSERGNVIEAEVVQGIRNAVGFDQAALKAVRQWKFEPGSVKGTKVRVWLRVAVEFKRSQSPPE